MPRSGRLRINVRVSYRPSDGDKGTQKRVLKLKER